MWLGPKFRGHVRENEDEFQKSDRLNFRHCGLLPPNLRIRGHLSAPIINGEEIEFENGPKWSNFRLSWVPDLDLGSGHGHYLFSSLIEYYLYTKFHQNRRNFLWTDGRTDGNLPPIVLGRLPKFGSRPKNQLTFFIFSLITVEDYNLALIHQPYFWKLLHKTGCNLAN